MTFGMYAFYLLQHATVLLVLAVLLQDRPGEDVDED
jgi:hypothetical protein